MTTLTQFLQTLASRHTDLLPACDVVKTLAGAGIDISKLLHQGALANIYGEAGKHNVQGEAQKKLDVIANDLLLEALVANEHCAGVASEELDDAVAAHFDGELLVLFDPLDGSSNIDINMPTGTIFSILTYQNRGNLACNKDFLQKGTAQLASGYLLYGAATILALTFNDRCFDDAVDNDDALASYRGVVMFSLDPSTGEFMLVRQNITIDVDTQEYAINASNYRHWSKPIQTYVDNVVEGQAGSRNKNFNTRWVAAMVADVHRILCRGGIFMYPYDNRYSKDNPKKAGKLRLMYEANPMSLLIENAGGESTDAVERIMDIDPTDIHQRVPVVLGSKNEVDHVRKLHLGSSK